MAEEQGQQQEQGPAGVNIPTLGMQMDKHPINLDSKEYTYALNANIESETGNGVPMLQNENSNLLCTTFKPGFVVVGTLPIPEENITLFFLVNPTTSVSEIGFINSLKINQDDNDPNDAIVNCDDCESTVLAETPLEKQVQKPLCAYTTLIDDTCAVLGYPLDKSKWLNFSIDNPVICTYKIDNCAIIIYWCDGLQNPMRYLRLDTDDYQREIPFLQIGTGPAPCDDPIFGTCVDVSRILVFPQIENPCITVTNIGTGGLLKAGTYQFAICYADERGETLSSYMGVTNPVPIFDVNQTITLEDDYQTSKSIQVSLNNIDTVRFRFVNLAVIKSINRVTSFELIITLPSPTSSYTYTGGEHSPIPLTFTDIISKYPYYQNANVVTTANNRLLWGGLTSTDITITNWQSIGMQLGRMGAVKWQTVRGDEHLYANPIASNTYRGYMRDEVYPLGIVFIMKNGQETNALHIPGRASQPADILPINTTTNKDYLSVTGTGCGTTNRDLTWQLYNTGSTTGFSPCYSSTAGSITQTNTVSCSGIPYYSGTIAPNILFGESNATTGGDWYEDITGPTWYTKISGSWVAHAAPAGLTCTIAPQAGCSAPVLVGCVPTQTLAACVSNKPTYANNVSVGLPAITSISTSGTPEYNLSTGVIQPNLTCGSATAVLVSGTAACTVQTYGYVLLDTNAPYAGCSGFDNNQVWFSFTTSITQTIAALSIQSYDTMIVEVWNGCPGAGGSIINIYDPVLAADPFLLCDGNSTAAPSPLPGGACLNVVANTGLYQILSQLTPNTTYYIKVYSPTQIASTHAFTICVTTPSPSGSATINVPAIYNNVCTYTIQCTVVVDSLEACLATPYNYGEMSYWESTANYPDNKLLYAEFACSPIRHHKFPDNCITHIHDQLGQSVVYGTQNKIFPIGFKLDVQDIKTAITWAVVNKYVTQEDANNIVGYKVVRGNRAANKSIIAKGLLYDMWNYTDYADPNYLKTVWYPSYPYNPTTTDNFLLDQSSHALVHPNSLLAGALKNSSVRYTFHSPDIHFNNPTLGSELKFETSEYGVARGNFTSVKDHAKYILLTQHAYDVALTIAAVQSALDVFTNIYPSLMTGVGAGATSFGAGSAAVVALSIVGMVVETVLVLTSDLFTYTAKWVEIIKNLGNPQQFGYFYTSVGRYTGYCCGLPDGYKLRGLTYYSYLLPLSTEFQEPTQATSTRINNWDRESSVYFYIGDTYPMPPSVYNCSIAVDNSNPTNSQSGNCTSTSIDTSIASYYVSNKNYISDQYGELSAIQYLDTGYCGLLDWSNNSQDNSCDTIFGGDTYISRFALKRKMNYFTFNAIGLTEDDEMTYSLYPNITRPAFYFDTIGKASIANVLFGTPQPATSFDCFNGYHNKHDYYYFSPAKIYLSNYGIPYFLCESDYNLNFRKGENQREKNFYPWSGDPVNWCQEVNVPISEDNYFFYNKDYSKQNTENFFTIPDISFDGPRQCMINHTNRVIYSLEDQYYDSYENIADSWLSYRANDYNDFNRSNGALIGIHGIENNNVLSIFENTSQMFNATAVIQSTPHDIMLGTGSMFSQKPREYMKTPLGYGGSQNKAWVATEFGYFWADAKRGEVYHLPIQLGYFNVNLDSVSKDGMRNWFKENLPFNILRDFPTYNIDNAYKDIGIAMNWDTRFQRVFLTKKDYKLIPSQRGKVTYNGINFLNEQRQIISLFDKTYFCDASWTVAYSPLSKTWISFYSFLPNYYVSNNGYFQTGINFSANPSQIGLWSHLLTNRSYQVFYGVLHPFKLEFVTKEQLQTKYYTSVRYQQKTIRYQNQYDFYTLPNVTFNKAVVYAEDINSGLLNLDVQQTNNLTQSILYPIQNTNSTSILVTNTESTWSFNMFEDIVKNTSLLAWFNNCGQWDKELNDAAIDYLKPTFSRNKLRSNYVRIRLINDIQSNYKMLFLFAENMAKRSIS